MKQRFISISLLVIGCLLFTPLYAEAVWGMGDITSDPGNTANTGAQVGTNSTQASNSVKDMVKEYGLDTAAYAFSNALATKMTNSIVNWINGGFKGAPSFINDFQAYFKKSEKQQAGYFLNELQNLTQSNPLIGPIIKDIALVSRNGSLQESTAFTLTNSVGQNWQGWATGSGGTFTNANDPWGGWMSLTELQNTPVGARMLSARALGNRIANNAKAKEREIMAGSGFLNQQVCVIPGPTKIPKQRKVENPEYEAWVQQNGGPGNVGLFGGSADTDPIGNALAPQPYITETYMEDIPKEKQECIQQKTNTPANTVQAALNKAIGTPTDRQTAATDYRQILTGALSQIAVALVNKGVQELKGEISNAIQGNDSNEDPNDPNSLTPQQENIWNNQTYAIDDINNSSFVYDVNNVRVKNTGNSGQFIPSWQINEVIPNDPNREYRFNQIELGIYYGQQQININREAISVAQAIPQRLLTLDQCIPGPDYGYKQRLQTMIGAKTRGMIQDADKADGQMGLIMRGLELESAVVIQSIASEMLDPKKNIPVAAEALAFIDKAESYQDTIEELRTSLNSTQRNVTALVILQNQWATATQTDNQAELLNLVNTFRGLDQARATENSLNDAKATLASLQATLNRTGQLYDTCNQQRQNPALTNINIPGDGTYLNAGTKTERFNIVNADAAQVLYCPVDIYKANEAARWISGNSHSGYGGDGISGLGVSLVNASETGIRCGTSSAVKVVNAGDSCTAQELIIDDNGNVTKRPGHPIDIITRHNPTLFNQYNPLRRIIFNDISGIKDITIDHPTDTIFINPDKTKASYSFNMVSFGVNCKDFYRSSLLDYTGLRSLY